MLVCKLWLQVCKNPCLNSAFDLEPPFESARWWTPEFERRVDSMLRSVVDWSAGSLKQIRTRHCSNQSLSHVAQRADTAVRCPMIRELGISYCHEVSHESLTLIGRNCPNLKILKRNMMNWLDPSEHTGVVPDEYLKTCPQDGNSEAAAIGKSMPNLEHVERRFSKLSAKGFTLISVGCPNLECLDFFGRVNLTSRDIENTTSNPKNLKEIKRPNFYIPRSVFHTESYGHWRLYDEQFQQMFSESSLLSSDIKHVRPRRVTLINCGKSVLYMLACGALYKGSVSISLLLIENLVR